MIGGGLADWGTESAKSAAPEDWVPGLGLRGPGVVGGLWGPLRRAQLAGGLGRTGGRLGALENWQPWAGTVAQRLNCIKFSKCF